ncbi:DUF3311 domain-containing protein [Actinoplanes sp. NPDC049265]|uniref:DUF3311 domain-containing protein n=1 Tax=Actinoplanes sp. NPDC049265 TaxID=3363902 RepID=UPI00371A33CF
MAEPETLTPAPRSDRSPWNWLLIIPIVVPVLTPIFNSENPRLGGFPLFYWIQVVFIILGVTTTTLVYRMTTKRRSPNE